MMTYLVPRSPCKITSSTTIVKLDPCQVWAVIRKDQKSIFTDDMYELRLQDNDAFSLLMDVPTIIAYFDVYSNQLVRQNTREVAIVLDEALRG